jgi:hypothetical protein
MLLATAVATILIFKKRKLKGSLIPRHLTQKHKAELCSPYVTENQVGQPEKRWRDEDRRRLLSDWSGKIGQGGLLSEPRFEWFIDKAGKHQFRRARSNPIPGFLARAYNKNYNARLFYGRNTEQRG